MPTAQKGSRLHRQVPSSRWSRAIFSSGGRRISTIRAASGGHSSRRASCSSTSTGWPLTGSRRVFPVSCRARSRCRRPCKETVTSINSPPSCRAPWRNTRCSSRPKPMAEPSSTGQLTSAWYTRLSRASGDPAARPMARSSPARAPDSRKNSAVSRQGRLSRRQARRHMAVPAARRHRGCASSRHPGRNTAAAYAAPRAAHRPSLRRRRGSPASRAVASSRR